MIELEFEMVFDMAQELQTIRLTREEVEEEVKAVRGFEKEGEKRKITVQQAAYIINHICMNLEVSGFGSK